MDEDDREFIERFRQSHHAIATYFALGYTPAKIMQITGKSRRSLTHLYNTPMFRELIAQKVKLAVEEGEAATREQIKADFDYRALATRNLIQGEVFIAEKFEAAELSGELPSLRDLNTITSDRADRLGFSKHTTVTHTHDFASQLDRAISRSNRQREVQTIEGEVLSIADLSNSNEAAAQTPNPTLVAESQSLAPKQHPHPPPRPASGPSFVDALKRRFA